MANRNENLKKINDELEKLTDEELDAVSGGAYWETAQDSEFLKKLGLCQEEYSGESIVFDLDWNKERAIQAGWDRIGVKFKWRSWSTENEYSINGKRVSRIEAYRFALEKVTGKKVK